jgi:hypothetical protein
MRALAAAGDPGGSRSLIAVLKSLEKVGIDFSIVRHGFLGKEAPARWPRETHHRTEMKGSVYQKIREGKYDIFLFSGSVDDRIPLEIGHIARECGLYLVSILDSWTSYSDRLKLDGKPVLYPDLYTVIDQHSYERAVIEGIPTDTLHLTGQPALFDLGCRVESLEFAKREDWLLTRGLNPEKKTILFVSEPVESDHSSSYESGRYRGYTEKIVLQQLLKSLEYFCPDLQLVVLPHPRENKIQLAATWNSYRGKLDGRMLQGVDPLEALFFSDGIIGMASIVLYQAWLCRKPTLSYQPNLCRQDLYFLQELDDCIFVSDPIQIDAEVKKWAKDVERGIPIVSLREDFQIHEKAPEQISSLILQLV